MTLTATVTDVTTCKKDLPGKPQIDIVQLNHNGLAYFIETSVGQVTPNQVVHVEASGLDHNGIPLHLRLIN